MSKSNHWMPLYIGDYLADTMHLNAQQHGAYLLLLMHEWRTGPLPDDDAQLSLIARCPSVDWSLVGPVVRAFFTTINGRLIQKRLENVRAEQETKADQRSKAGKASAAQRERQRKSNETSTKQATRAPTKGQQLEPEPEPEPEREKEQEEREVPNPSGSPSPAAPARQPQPPSDPDFDAFWAAYPRKVGKDEARKAWAKARKRATVQDIAEALRRQRWPDDRKFIPHPATWLNQGRWQDDPGAAAPPEHRPQSVRAHLAESLGLFPGGGDPEPAMTDAHGRAVIDIGSEE